MGANVDFSGHLPYVLFSREPEISLETGLKLVSKVEIVQTKAADNLGESFSAENVPGIGA